MKPNPVAAAVTSALSNIAPSAPTNTEVVLASQAEPQQRKDEGDGTMPKANALVSDRSRVLKEIAERRNAQAVEEGNETVTQTDGDGNEVETAPPDAEIKGADLDTDGAEQTETVTAAAPEKPAAPVVEETRTIIVDGQSMQVPVSKIIERGTATFQKETAADLRLKQATEILEEARRVAQPVAAKTEEKPTLEGLTNKQLAEMVQFGTPEQAEQAFEILRAPKEQVNSEEVVKRAVQAVPRAMAFEEGKKFAIAEYLDLLQDPDLGTIFLNRENVARAQGDPRPPVELYKAIGEDIRTKFNRPKPGAALKPTPAPDASTKPARTMEEKREAKAAAPQLPRLASARLDGDANTPRPKTRAEIIAGMSRTRGFSQGKNL